MLRPERRVIVCDTDGVLMASHVPMNDAINNALINYALHGKLLQSHEWITGKDWISFEAPIEICEKFLGQTPTEIATWLFADEVLSAGQGVAAAQHYLAEMLSRGAEIHVVTSRTPDQRQATLDSIQKWYPFIPQSNIHLRTNPTQPGREYKLEMAILLGATEYFDDDVTVIKLAEKLLPPWIALNMIRQTWNEQYTDLEKYLVTWESLLESIR